MRLTLLAALLLLAACGEGPSAGPPPGTEVALGAAHCEEALPEVPACGSGGVCDTDADCAALPGNYCEAAVCAADDGCLRGFCTPTRVMGEPCDRDAECASGPCEAPPDGGAELCTAGDGGVWMGPFP